VIVLDASVLIAYLDGDDAQNDAATQVARPRDGRVAADARLKMPDCCVLVASEDRRARLATFDDRLAAAAVDPGVTAITAGRARGQRVAGRQAIVVMR